MVHSFHCVWFILISVCDSPVIFNLRDWGESGFEERSVCILSSSLLEAAGLHLAPAVGAEGETLLLLSGEGVGFVLAQDGSLWQFPAPASGRAGLVALLPCPRSGVWGGGVSPSLEAREVCVSALLVVLGMEGMCLLSEGFLAEELCFV